MATAASSTTRAPKANEVGASYPSYPNGVNGYANGHHSDNPKTDTVQQTFHAAKSRAPDFAGASLNNRVSPIQNTASAKPTLEEKKELCELLKKAIKDPLDPRPLEIPAMARELENSGYDDAILAKLQKEIYYLCLGACGLQTLPNSIRLLKGMRELNLSSNQLETLPDGLLEIPELYTLHLQGNRFKKVPPVVMEMAKQHGFSRLDLDKNRELKEIPISLKQGVRIISLPEWYTPIDG